jgi:hypothetical protein
MCHIARKRATVTDSNIPERASEHTSRPKNQSDRPNLVRHRVCQAEFPRNFRNLQRVFRLPVMVQLPECPPIEVSPHRFAPSSRPRMAVHVAPESPFSTIAKSAPRTEMEAADGTRISRTLVNFWLDVALMVAFTGLSLVAVIVQFVFPPGTAAKGWTLWTMNYGQWCSMQFGLLCTLGLGVVVHVMLHWTWVCGVITRQLLRKRVLPDDGIRTVYGVGLLIVLLLTGAAVVGIAMMTIQMPPQ